MTFIRWLAELVAQTVTKAQGVPPMNFITDNATMAPIMKELKK